MNAYTTEFFSNCPNNGMRIKYRLRIESREIIPVEQITAKVGAISEGFHLLAGLDGTGGLLCAVQQLS